MFVDRFWCETSLVGFQEHFPLLNGELAWWPKRAGLRFALDPRLLWWILPRDVRTEPLIANFHGFSIKPLKVKLS